jgi:hypothetical protein
MRRSLLVGAVAVMVFVVVAGTAWAGSYTVSACTGVAPVNNSWQPFNNNPAYLETSASCGASEITGGSGATSGLAAADVLRLSTNVPAGALAGWRITAPAGDEISAIGMDRDLYEQGEGWVPQVIDAEGAVLPGEICSFDAMTGGCEASGPVMHTGLDTTSLAIELLCDPEPFGLSACSNGFSEHDARVELGSATVTITDEQPPKITGTTGSLFTGGLVHGTLSGAISASDNSGVQYARVYLDGALVAQQTYPCDFTQPAPCPAATTSGQLSLNTSTLSDGPHEIQAAVVDAAGNQTFGQPVQVTVDNTPPSAPAGLQVEGHPAGVWVNHPATITWSNPGQPAEDPLSQVNWVACPGAQASIPASGCDAVHSQTSPLSSLTFDPGQDPVFAGQPQDLYTVFVWLQDKFSMQGSPAAVSFGYQTSSPPAPSSIAVSGQGPYTVKLGAPAHLAPIVASEWSACKTRGPCTPVQSSPGLAFVFAPSRIAQFKRSPYGQYTIRAWLLDAAGNATPANSVTVKITHRRRLPGPQLRILAVKRTSRGLYVHGSAARALSGRLGVLARYRLKARARTAHKTIRVAKGRWAAVLELPGRARVTSVTVVRRGSRRWRAQSVTRRIA